MNEEGIAPTDLNLHNKLHKEKPHWPGWCGSVVGTFSSPVHQKVMGSIPSQGTYSGFRFSFSLLSLSPPNPRPLTFSLSQINF